MSDAVLDCRRDARRDAVRAATLHGLDFLEVEPGRTTLTVTFLGKAPERVGREHVRIDGGRRVTGIVLVGDPDVHHHPDPAVDDWMVVRVDRPGDFSTYTLRVVEPGGQSPMYGFDVRYAAIDFTFMADCPSELDCAAPRSCPPLDRPAPEIDYLAKDYGSFRQLMLDRLSLLMPEWRERNPLDLGIAVVELLAYVGDRLSYYQDAVATEAYLQTARQRISVRRHARLVDYQMHEGCNARVWVRFEATGAVDIGRAHGLPFSLVTGLPQPYLAGKSVLRGSDLETVDPATYESFDVIDDAVHIDESLQTLPIYTWGDAECCLPAGATRATLEGDATLPLAAGTFLLFEEIVGPTTGEAGDADPSHRHVVRLTRVATGCDPLTGTAVVEIEWAREDALPFPLCISSVSGPPHCKRIDCVSVARGNVFLADHGRWTSGLTPGTVPVEPARQRCEGIEEVSDPLAVAGRFAPRLLHGPLTFSQPIPADAPAATRLRQDPRCATPVLVVTDSTPRRWSPRRDLLESGPADAHLVVEVDDAGFGHLRFSRDDTVLRPAPGATFEARHRVGIGKAGHIGARMLQHVVFHGGLVDGVSVTNPLPASGGVDPEPIAEVKAIAPHAFRATLRRAITPEDYATLAQAPYEPRVQRAQARFLWTGSFTEVAVAIDPAADVPEGEQAALARAVQRRLQRVRRIGHDVRVRVAQSVPLRLSLRVCVVPDALRGHVKAALLDALGNRPLPGGRRGFFHPNNLSLGESIAVSRIVAAAHAVEGVYSIEVLELHAQFEPQGDEIETGVLEVLPWQMPRLDNDPSLPEHGTLELDMWGGR